MKSKILIIGGLGFIGKNLYQKLIQEGKVVKILTDRVIDEGDKFLNESVKSNLIVGSILNKEFIEQTLVGYDVIFSLAGSSGASDSIKDPYKDLDTNLKGHLNILEACRKFNPKALLIFPSSRLVYGKPNRNPVDEHHPLRPESIYAIHKVTTEHYYLLYQELYNLPCIIFRISNPYGPFQRFGGNHYGILNWFIYKAVHHEAIEIYGEGSQKRDFFHIDDLVNLFSMSLSEKKMIGKIFNVGYGKGISIRDIAETIAAFLPETKIVFKPWPEIDKKIETGDYISDIQLLKKEIGWEPMISFEEGVKSTIRFYEGITQ